MKWFQGNIADAVSESKSTNAIFVVFVEGLDEMSRTMSSVLDMSGVSANLSSSKFICIKLAKDSESHQQFTEIYQIVPVPSLFFIGENGVPLEIIAGDKAVDNVSRKITSAISKITGNSVVDTAVVSSPTPTVLTPSTSTSSDNLTKETTPPRSNYPFQQPLQLCPENFITPALLEEDVNETMVVYKDTADEEKARAADVDKVKELFRQRKEESQKLEEERKKEMELSRRRMGKEIAEAKKAHQDRELEELRKEREKEKKLDAEARQRVLRQIEEDKANRAARAQKTLSNPPPTTNTPQQSLPRSPTTSPDTARIQFKLPDGQTRTQTFPADTTLRDLRQFIDSNIEMPFKEYTLATTFPRREFNSRDLPRNLSELELLPSSVLLILPIQGNVTVMRGPGWTATMTAMLWALIQPVLDIGYYLKSLITGTRRPETEDTPASSQPEQEPSTSDAQPAQPEEPLPRQPYYNNLGGGKSVRKRGNVHTLSDGNDSNDENNTWNGNSTQLM